MVTGWGLIPLAAAGVFAVTAWAAPARADGPEAPTPVGIAPLVVDGELEPHFRNELHEQLTEGLRRGRFELRPLATASKCDAKCRLDLARRTGVRYLVVAKLTVAQRDYRVVIDLVDTRSGETVATTEQGCELCGIGEVGEVVEHQAAALRARLEAISLGPPLMVVEAQPTGTLIELDGEPVGQAPLRRELEPGEHWVSAMAEGYVGQRRQVQAVAGVRETVIFELKPTPGADRARGFRAGGWSAIGIGIAAVATGIPLIAIDQRPNRLRCSGDDVDADGDCRLRYATLEAGIAVTVVGVGLIATGAGLIVAAKRRRKPRRMAIGVGWRSIAWSGRF